MEPARAPAPGPTSALATFVAASRIAPLPPHVRQGACRLFANWLGCALGARDDAAVEAVLRVAAGLSGRAQACVIGRADRLDVVDAALVNGVAANALDYDDMHAPTLIHPSGPVVAAALAEADFDSATDVLEAKFGVFDVFGRPENIDALTLDLGARYIVPEVSLKPYPCGVVIHPLIDACLELARRRDLRAEDIRRITAVVHPRAIELAGRQHPGSAIAGRFSLFHAAAVALTRGSAGLAAFDQADVDDPVLYGVRERMVVESDSRLRPGAARVRLELSGGTRLEHAVEYPSGSPERPLTDAQLHDKFVELAARAVDGREAQRAGLSFVHVPYRGAALALNDMAGGRVVLLFTTVASAKPLLDAGRVRALAVAAPKRVASLAAVPTFPEAGLKGVDAPVWVGVLAPKGTPSRLVSSLNSNFGKILANPEFRRSMAAWDAEISGDGPVEFGRSVREDIERWRAWSHRPGSSSNECVPQVCLPESGGVALVTVDQNRGNKSRMRKEKMMSLLSHCVWLACAFAAAPTVAQQAYPSKPIRLILPFPPGGSTDIVARLIGQKLTESWGQPVLVDNRPGAGGNIAAETAAKAPADGYTLFQVNVANAIGATLYPKLNYDLVTSFAPVTQLATTPYVLLAHPSVPARNTRDLLAIAKTRPGVLNYASAGAGSATHLSGELLKSLSGTDILHVPYKGTGPAVIALLSGEVDLYFTAVPAAVPLVKAGRVRALGVTSAKRSPLMPDVAPIAEAGLKGYETGTWHGILVPAATPKDIVARLNTGIVRILAQPDVQERLLGQGLEPIGGSPEQFGAYIKSEIAKWAKVVKASGARAE